MPSRPHVSPAHARLMAAMFGAASLLTACRPDVAAPAEPVALRITLLPADSPGIELQIGGAYQFAAVPVAADSTPLRGPVAARWASADTSVAVVDAAGTLRVRCLGAARITATVVQGGRTLRGTREIDLWSYGERCAGP